jgi:isocitrate dehydrogenase
LRWDSLGEFLALAVSIEELAEKSGNTSATLLANALNDANGRYLDEDRSPSRNVGELDTRGSHFYIALYWAEAVASQTVDAALAARFAPIAKALATNEAKIVTELNAAQGVPVDIGGYYHPDDAMAFSALRPSPTLNAIIDAV